MDTEAGEVDQFQWLVVSAAISPILQLGAPFIPLGGIAIVHLLRIDHCFLNLYQVNGQHKWNHQRWGSRSQFWQPQLSGELYPLRLGMSSLFPSIVHSVEIQLGSGEIVVIDHHSSSRTMTSIELLGRSH